MLHHVTLSKLCLARDALKENADQKISIKSLAQDIGMSNFHFIRLFSAVFGLTPHRYRIVNQLEKAKNELISSQKLVTDIAFDCGFSSLGTFCSVFKRYAGMPAKAYRDTYSLNRAIPQHMPEKLIHSCFGLMLGFPDSNF
jgi:AraC-like DNA-binding protein